MLPARQVSEEARKRFCACMMYMKTRSSDVREDIKGKHITVLVFSDENVTCQWCMMIILMCCEANSHIRYRNDRQR